uniref:NADP-dependent oxidoreductase domain-containing protein n=1 Tax=Timema monikensis TaxID=170555 RepID=A0A7R9E4R5_9NEOP|nr:unnamed protein product [Timema monikensis]
MNFRVPNAIKRNLLSPRPVFDSSRPIIRLCRQQACLDLLHSDVTRRRKGRITSLTAARRCVLFFSGRRACDGPACVGVRVGKFRYAQITLTTLHDTPLVTLNDENISQTQFEQALLNLTTLHDTPLVTLNDENISQTQFEQALLTLTTLHDTPLVTLNDENISQTQFEQALLNLTTLHDTKLRQCTRICLYGEWKINLGKKTFNAIELASNLILPVIGSTVYHERSALDTSGHQRVGLMTWSPLTMGLVSGKLEDGGMPLFARASFKNKYSSFSWTEDETQAANKEGYTWIKERLQPEETRRQQDKLKDIAQLSEKLGCTVSQLAIAWCLKNESVQCLLLGAATVEQLYESIQSLQVTTRQSGSILHGLQVTTRSSGSILHGLQLVPKLNTTTMTELERILDNKPTRPPMVSTLALR